MLKLNTIQQWLARSSKKTAQRVKPIANFSLTVMMTLSMLMTSLGLQYASVAAAPAANVVGQGFTVTPADLAFILKQIKIAERHSRVLAGVEPGVPANPNPTGDPVYCQSMVGMGVDQIPNPLLSFGLRTVDGTCNNLQPSQSKYGAADQTFPRLTTPVFGAAETTPPDFGPPNPTSYAQTSGLVFDSEPRMISNLIVDQTSTNPAAVQAAGFPLRSQGGNPVVACTSEPDPLLDPDGTPDGCVPQFQTLFIENVTTDAGLSPPFNGLFTIFGQFFDHGLDKITNGGNGSVFVPLKADDPLIAGFDHILGTADDIPANMRFMVLTRGKIVTGADGFRNALNTDTPFVDQSQTYTSHASHQIFLREYVNNLVGRPVSTGKFLSTPDGGLATWAMIKTQAATMLGLQLVDANVGNIPMIASDPYGNFIPGPARGLPQYVTATGLVEGNTAAPVPAPANVIFIDTAFLNDIAHSAAPTAGGPDTDLTAGGSLDIPSPVGSYDNELLDIHAICGDGRCNENIALQAVHQIFHNEHDRLIDDIENVIVTDTSGVTNLADWQLATGANGWNGERLFQAARFVTEMEYQHLVFEEFARKVQPGINPFEPFAFNQTDIDPAITAEFAHAVYRFGHSMLTEEIARTNADGSTNNISLFDGFLNPAEYYDGGSAGVLSSQDAAGAIIMGMSDQAGNEIDEFVTDVLRNRLVGLPLDLAAINMTRARSEGVPPLNSVRRQIFAATNDGSLRPYTDWIDFGLALKHPESLVNFVAAYGTHPTVASQSTLAGRRSAADQIVNGTTLPGPDGILFDNPLTFIDESLDDVAGVPAGPGPDGVLGDDPLTFIDESLDDTAAIPAGPGPDGILGDDPLTLDVDESLDDTPAIPAGCGPDGICGDDPLTFIDESLDDTAAIPASCGPDGVCGDDLLTFIDESADNIFPPTDSADFMFGVGAWAGVNTGLEDVDLWMGGLAEHTNTFGGLLGSTFNYVFEKQMTDLQNGDRFYYLARTPGMNLRAQLEGNSFAELVMRNTNAHTLKADPFATADCKFELGNLTFGASGFVNDDPASGCEENLVLIRMADGTIRYRLINAVDPSGINAQAVYNGAPGDVVDRIHGGTDNDTFWGGLGNDIIEGGDGADIALGGEGNDIITDLAGDDVPKGGPGNDAIDGGPGLDILMGGDGQDFMNGGANTNETFGGEGNDFVIAGQGMDAVFGDGGDDWIEGGDQPDLLIGDSSSLFFDDNNLPGHDIFFGQGGDDDYDSEGGDDILVAGPGVEKNAGTAGYDWSIGLGDPQPQNADLALPLLAEQPPVNEVRDRFNEVEALSGWMFNDILRGDSLIPVEIGGGGFIGCDALDQAGLDRIAGLDALVPPLNTPTANVLANSVTNYCLLTGPFVWGDGNILLGGAGSDLLEGRGGNDILDGDKYLSVRLSLRTNPSDALTEIGSTNLMENAAVSGNFGAGTAGKTLQQAVFAGLVDPGNLVAVREILNPGAGTDVDTAKFSGPQTDYQFIQNLDGSVTVTDTTVVGGGGGAGDDGTDTLWNIEQLEFCNGVDPITLLCNAPVQVLLSNIFRVNSPATGTVTIDDLTPTEDQVLTATPAIADPDGLGTLTISWQSEITLDNWVEVGTGLTFVPQDNAVDFRLRAVASFFDGFNAFETVVGDVTASVININDVPTGLPTLDSNTPLVGSPLNASTAGIGDDDGLVGVTFSFEWLANGVVIVGETGESFVPTAAQGGQTLQVRVSFTDNHGTAESLTSASTAAVPAPVAQVTPGSLAFGNQNTGTTSVAQTITVTNTGNATLTVTGAPITGDLVAQFAVQASDCGVVLPGASCTIDVVFAPTLTGLRTATLGIIHDGLGGSPTNVALSGTGVASTPIASVTPASLVFGSVNTGTLSATQNITVTNTGNANLVVSGVTLGGTDPTQFAIVTNGCGVTIAPAGSCTITVRFNPTTIGAKSAAVSITHNAAGSPSIVDLSGTGVTASTTATIANVAFGTRRVNTNTIKTVLVTNTGTAPLIITTASLPAGPFTLTLGTCNVPVAVGRTCKLNVTFRPTDAIAYSRILTITSNATNAPSGTMTGTGR